MDQLKDVAEVLKPLEAITSEWSAEKYVTLSKVIPMINGLTEQLQTLEPNTAMGKQLKIVMLAEISKRFGQVEKVPMFAIATLLDPRFKKIDFKSSIDCSQAVNFVKNALLQQHQPFPESSDVLEPTEIIPGEQSESL
ncbi:zinc finger BED domain-containing protein 1-like [Belonocnema kinseyi]|uniref:zinc finger BED domain-containing protein 1-like n=1 Tax=Belonocnema kinseyi TaxID=2817044 RepID=UPI00143E0E8F|nr:zinc finger BED domain-containing protein 1-like [Belonocnema kinseyi]